MTPSVSLLALLAGATLAEPGAITPSEIQTQSDNCVSCHRALSSERLSAPAVQFPGDVHGSAGFSCVACHGGDATIAGLGGMDPALGFIGTPTPEQIPHVCGRCHSDAEFMRRYDPSLRVDQEIEYRTSVHGRRLLEEGDQRVATCASCHGAHSIEPASSPQSRVHPLRVAETCGSCHSDSTRMAEYAIPTDQEREYRESIHWAKMSVEADLSAPTCNDCHGNHGAAPPGLEWVGNVCGNCHLVNADLFEASPHAAIFAMMGVPGCASCHGNHRVEAASDDMVGIGDGSVCVRCHGRAEDGPPARIRDLIDTLVVSYGAADSILDLAENAGMEVSAAQFELTGARTALVSARAAIHSFSVEGVATEVDGGLEIATTAIDRGERALRDLWIRRVGLAISVVIILLLISGLVLKIRQLER